MNDRAMPLSTSSCPLSRLPSADAPANATPRLVFLGTDADGAALEVVAVELEDESLLVIHAMPLRARYRSRYEEMKRWRR